MPLDDLPDWLPAWYLDHLGSEPAGVLFQVQQISMVFGLRLAGGTDVVVKARADDGRAVRLALAEDGLGWQSARCWPAVPGDGASVYEIRGPDQWAGLVDRYPLDVSKSRRHDWWRVTGWAGRWLIPDYAAAAADWDAVHVTVAGYLATAGIAIPAGDGARTMLAGWDPDATWWLTDVLAFTRPPEDWRKDDQAPFGWTQARQL